MTHASAADSPLAVDPGLIRLSVGLETLDDLLADLTSALDRAGRGRADSSSGPGVGWPDPQHRFPSCGQHLRRGADPIPSSPDGLRTHNYYEL